MNYVYGAAGNMTDDGQYEYVYDAESEPPETGSSSSSSWWQVATYTYDPAGRRIAKSINGTVAVKHGAACPELVERDGPQCIAEYDVNDTLLRKYIYGPGIDQPICMIEAGGTYSGAYYYHFDGLGSVVALSDDDGDTVVTYEYDAYGLPASSDPNHPNTFLFTARRYDSETGLYHYRARAYNPYIGRFLQLDSAQQGMNWYAYCSNNGVNYIDPSGCWATADPWSEISEWMQGLCYSVGITSGQDVNGLLNFFHGLFLLLSDPCSFGSYGFAPNDLELIGIDIHEVEIDELWQFQEYVFDVTSTIATGPVTPELYYFVGILGDPYDPVTAELVASGVEVSAPEVVVLAPPGILEALV